MKPAFNVKSAHLDALSIQLQSSQIDEVRETLQLNVGKYLKFKALPFILDARQLEDGENVPFSEILALFALYQLRIVGLRHGDASWERYAEQHNLAFLPIEKMATAIVPDVDGATPSEETAETAPNEADAPSRNAEADDAPKIIFHQPVPVTDASTEEAKPAETSEASTENTATSTSEEPPATTNEIPELEEAEAFARELFGDMEETAPTAPAPEVATETVEASESDTLSNDNDAIKTVEMAKMADLVEISAEERRLDEEAPSELSSEDGEAKGEIVSVSEAKRTIVVSTPVRTGQQIYAEKADLIVLGIVSPGAEVIADGNIHIYAPLRGRALAGASGDTKARIFVQSMQAELVSIAGIYRTFEQKLPQHLHRKPVQIELQDDRLAISSIVAE